MIQRFMSEACVCVCVCVCVLVVAGGRWGIESPESGLGYKDKWFEFYSVNNGAALESF